MQIQKFYGLEPVKIIVHGPLILELECINRSNGGASWEYVGLRNTQHIGRIIAHPTDVNIAWIGSMGALYSNNEDRGVYKTMDGGATWTKTLFINDSTGVIDLAIHPETQMYYGQLHGKEIEKHGILKKVVLVVAYTIRLMVVKAGQK